MHDSTSAFLEAQSSCIYFKNWQFPRAWKGNAHKHLQSCAWAFPNETFCLDCMFTVLACPNCEFTRNVSISISVAMHSKCHSQKTGRLWSPISSRLKGPGKATFSDTSQKPPTAFPPRCIACHYWYCFAPTYTQPFLVRVSSLQHFLHDASIVTTYAALHPQVNPETRHLYTAFSGSVMITSCLQRKLTVI